MKNVFKTQSLLSVLIVLISVCSCNKTETDAEKRQKEDQEIKNYVAKNYAAAKASATGLYYISELEGTGDAPGDSDYVVIKYKAWTLDSKMFDSTDTTDILTYNLSPLFVTGGPLQYNMRVFPGWNEALKQMKAGGKAIAIIPSILFYNDFVPRKYEIELVEVIHDIAAYEKQNIKNYVTARGTATVDSTNGIYYYETFTGTGTVPASGNTVYYQYKGRLMDGMVFSKSDPSYNAYFTIGLNSPMPGLDAAFLKMKKGGKATVVIPYNQGYGSKAWVYYGQIIVPWYSTLVFDLQLVDVQ